MCVHMWRLAVAAQNLDNAYANAEEQECKPFCRQELFSEEEDGEASLKPGTALIAY